jgi:hypothetical protein
MKIKTTNILNRIVLSLSIILMATSLYATSILLNYFNARTDGRNVTIEWKANNEDGLRFYELERSEDNAVYSRVFRQGAKGTAFNYRFVDEDALKETTEINTDKVNTTMQNKSYSYRLKMLFEDGSSKYSDVTFVSQNVNSVRRTWGMIKEMFR